MKTAEAKQLISEIECDFPDLPVRLVLGVPEDQVHELVAKIKSEGWSCNIQSSAYEDIEVVVTKKEHDRARSAWY
jgi:hypothetical protein